MHCCADSYIIGRYAFLELQRIETARLMPRIGNDIVTGTKAEKVGIAPATAG